MSACSVPELALFPLPYPGESFYSVLCRYHVRSCHVSSRLSRQDLFGSCHVKLSGAILSPLQVRKVCQRVPEPATPAAEEILWKNTAFPLFSIMASPRLLACVRKKLGSGQDFSDHLVHMQSGLIHHSGYLRFCPECARVQTELYGESYWQILPQLEGAEYCPLHQTRILPSSVKFTATRFSFHPASYVLGEQPCRNRAICHEEEKTEALIEKEKDFFLAAAGSFMWLMANAPLVEGYHTLFKAYQRILGDDFSGRWTENERLKHLFFRAGHSENLYTYIMSQATVKRFGRSDAGTAQLLPLSAHILLMTAISRTPARFYGVDKSQSVKYHCLSIM